MSDERYTRDEALDAERTMAALVRAYNRDPVGGVDTDEIKALLGNDMTPRQLRAVILTFLGAFRMLAIQHAKLTAAVRGEDLDPVAFLDDLLGRRQALLRSKEADGDTGGG
jgi:hypothetical protein